MALSGMGQVFWTPFYSGGTQSELVPSLYPVAINGHPYLIEWKEYRRRTIDALRQAQDTEQLPSEGSLSVEGFWPRFQGDWSLGAGQIHFDDRDQAYQTRRRFYASAGVDPWTPRQLTLLPNTRRILNTANATSMLIAGDYLYVADSTTMRVTGNPFDASPTWTACTGTPGTAINAITTDGTRVFIATNSGVYSATLGGTVFAVFTTGAEATTARQMIEVVNGRLLAGRAHIFEEIPAAGTSTVLYTHVNTSFRWTAIGGSQRSAYAAGNAGTVSTFLRFGVDVATGGLQLQGPASALPTGEFVTSILSYVGLVVLGTSKGVRLANVDADGSLTYGQVIGTGRVRGMAADADFVWFGWDAIYGTGRLRLSEFAVPDDQIPAYAADVVAPSGTTGNCLAVARLLDETYFIVAGQGVYGTFSDAVPTGYVETGWLDFGTWFTKTLIDLDMRHAALHGSIAVSIIDTEGAEEDYASSNTSLSDRPINPIPFAHARHERFKIKLTLTADASLVSPVLYSWALRVSPSPPRCEEYLLPIIFKTNLNVGYGGQQAAVMDLVQELEHIKLLTEDGQVCTYQEGDQLTQVQLTNWELQGYKERGDGPNETYAIEGKLLVSMRTI